MLQANEKIIGHAVEKYYDALERVLDDTYTKEDEIVVMYFYLDFAKAIAQEFNTNEVLKLANALYLIGTEFK